MTYTMYGTYSTLVALNSATDNPTTIIAAGLLNDGLLMPYNGQTVVNVGTIIGSSDAVQFAAGYANRLIIDPGAVFSGKVTGGDAIGSTHVSTPELASGASVGAPSGLGTQFIDFAQVTVDAGAQWTLAGVNILLARATLTDAGTLTNAGTLNGAPTLAVGGVLSIASRGRVTALGGAAVSGLTGGAATVVNTGAIVDTDTDTDTGGRGIYLTAGGSV